MDDEGVAFPSLLFYHIWAGHNIPRQSRGLSASFPWAWFDDVAMVVEIPRWDNGRWLSFWYFAHLKVWLRFFLLLGCFPRAVIRLDNIF